MIAALWPASPVHEEVPGTAGGAMLSEAKICTPQPPGDRRQGGRMSASAGPRVIAAEQFLRRSRNAQRGRRPLHDRTPVQDGTAGDRGTQRQGSIGGEAMHMRTSSALVIQASAALSSGCGGSSTLPCASPNGTRFHWNPCDDSARTAAGRKSAAKVLGDDTDMSSPMAAVLPMKVLPSSLTLFDPIPSTKAIAPPTSLAVFPRNVLCEMLTMLGAIRARAPPALHGDVAAVREVAMTPSAVVQDQHMCESAPSRLISEHL